jgi:hypothetical protein
MEDNMSEREEWMQLIRNEYDPAPRHYKMGDNWDDGAGRIADAIIADKTLAGRRTWRPIETAPKDGSHILACRMPIGIRVTVNTNPPTVVHWFDDPNDPGFYTSVNAVAPEYPYNPTHWQPLDPLP